MDNWQVNDVIQIDSEHDERFGGCFIQVTEVKSWGVKGFVAIPGNVGERGQAFYLHSYSYSCNL